MIKICYDGWNANEKALREKLKELGSKLWKYEYEDLLKLTVETILGGGWNSEEITRIDDGDYQGTLLFLFHQDTYQPCEAEYLMTCVSYGSCSGCDTLLAISQYRDDDDNPPNEDELNEYLDLCRDMVMHMISPYNQYSAFGHRKEFEVVELDPNASNN